MSLHKITIKGVTKEIQWPSKYGKLVADLKELGQGDGGAAFGTTINASYEGSLDVVFKFSIAGRHYKQNQTEHDVLRKCQELKVPNVARPVFFLENFENVDIEQAEDRLDVLVIKPWVKDGIEPRGLRATWTNPEHPDKLEPAALTCAIKESVRTHLTLVKHGIRDPDKSKNIIYDKKTGMPTFIDFGEAKDVSELLNIKDSDTEEAKERKKNAEGMIRTQVKVMLREQIPDEMTLVQMADLWGPDLGKKLYDAKNQGLTTQEHHEELIRYVRDVETEVWAIPLELPNWASKGPLSKDAAPSCSGDLAAETLPNGITTSKEK